MRARIILLSLLLFIFAPGCFAQETRDLKNMRFAKGNTLVSDSLPKVKLKFGKDFKYAGGQTFILYGIARAEQHSYVDAAKDGPPEYHKFAMLYSHCSLSRLINEIKASSLLKVFRLGSFSKSG